MEAMIRLNKHLRERPSELMNLKKSGTKIVGYAAGGFAPLEMIYAAGAVPVCLGMGGDPEVVTESMTYTPIFLCTYCRSQIAYYKLGEAPYYQITDLFVIPIVDANNKLIADSFCYFTDVNVFRFGVPHDKRPIDVDYYKYGLTNLKKKLEELTGNTITDEKLKKEIEIENKRRSLLKAISDLRIGADPVISSKDYVALHHAAFYADREIYLEVLQEIYDELKAKRVTMTEKKYSGPRIMFIGNTLAHGDVRIHEIVDTTNAEIVYEEFAEGIVPYLNNVDTSIDPLDGLADCYFTKRIRNPWDRPWGDRFDCLLAKAKEFDCQVVIWYQTLYRDGSDLQSWTYGKKFKEAGLNFVKIETNYNAAEKGPMRTRIETAIEMLGQSELEAAATL
ncbi:2-hydroxyacyl-CoA dehydratase family protein [Dehalobacter sp. DCM]|uniref:2-hydroxyacyl-CoA dehydratase subunit D n=1 Tax=Dehalobacter sp. DCM TaxID=2907827 RepID=UPI0030818CE3|nr:2-hydroxyacyl-CoA dehydratase family protein [Dehalobacter sp. DCM]